MTIEEAAALEVVKVAVDAVNDLAEMVRASVELDWIVSDRGYRYRICEQL